MLSPIPVLNPGLRAVARRALGLALPLLLSACASSPPHAPGGGAQSDAAHGTVAGTAPGTVRIPVPQALQSHQAWWQQLEDPTLRQLTQVALQRNGELQQAVARVASLRQAETATRSRLLPQVGLQAAASATETGLPESVKRAGQPDNRALRATLDLSWEIDLFGGVRAAARASRADTAAASAQQEAAAQMVGAEVTRQYVQWQAAVLRGRWLTALAEHQADQARWHAQRRQEGLVSGLEDARVQSDLADAQSQATAALPQGRAAEARLRTLLHGQTPALPAPDSLKTIATLPQWTGRPSLELLRQRPDVRAAEQQWAAEDARWEESRAALWPRLLLGASVGQQDLRLNSLDLAASVYRNVVAAFTLPLLNHGRLQALQQAQGLRTSAAALQWERAMLNALEEVDAALAQQAQAVVRATATRTIVEEREHLLRRSDALLAQGLIDRSQWTEARKALAAAQLQHIDAQAQRALSDLQLIRALGGAGFQRNPPV